MLLEVTMQNITMSSFPSGAPQREDRALHRSVIRLNNVSAPDRDGAKTGAFLVKYV